ncbi:MULTISPECIES: efflux RND transporter periplasmic adaptor subunit [Listeria]|uniref:efflux RND transporter periplasmic adaptor subunit n=1 Tax=Listeria TaxID=1637 RepID=UPI000B5871DD|nr:MULTISPECIES: HlyD family secretion protein [Listeria]
MKKWIIAIIVIVVIGGGVIWFLNKGGEKKSADTSDFVTTKVKQGDMKINATGTGAIVPQNKQFPDYDELEFQAQMDELDIPNIKVDQAVTVSVTALPDKTFKGKVKTIADQGQAQNGVSSFPVTISLENTDGLKSGMTADASILVNEKKDALYVPIEAVQKDDDNRYYVMVPKKEKEGRTKKEKQFVETGLHNEDNIEITKGLKKGDTVILPSQKSTTTEGGF